VNLPPFVAAMPALQEVSIGHALITDALWLGLSETIKRYLRAVNRLDGL
jgi:pyridoxine 5-phosphate synthase